MIRSTRSRIPFELATLLALVVGFSSPANSQVEDDYEAALDAMLADPGNPQKSFDFARTAAQAGDLRGAVAAFERILRLNPLLANSELELGVLYLQLGNAELGRYHIGRALEAPDVPVVVRSRAESYLASSLAAEPKRHSFQGQASVATRYDSNANAGPASEIVLAGGQEFPLLSGGEFKDASVEATLSLTHNYGWGKERGHSLETNALFFRNAYRELDDLDLAVATVDFGPLLAVGRRTATPLLIKPFVSTGYYTLADEKYFDADGGGIEIRKFAQRAFASFRVHYEDQVFNDTPTRFVSDRSGDHYAGTFRYQRRFGSRFQLGLTALTEQADAAASYQTYDRVGGGVDLTWSFGSSSTRPPWTFMVGGRVRDANYDAPDPAVDPNITREDSRVDSRVAFEIPLNRNVVIAVEGDYTDNDSNLLNYEFDNHGGAVSVRVQF